MKKKSPVINSVKCCEMHEIHIHF